MIKDLAIPFLKFLSIASLKLNNVVMRFLINEYKF